jgi:hypothetical protein
MERRDPLALSVVHRAIGGGVRALIWACGYLSRLLLARAVVAFAIIVASLTIATYALWIGAILWMVTGRFGIFRPQRWRFHVEAGVALLAIGGLLGLCALEGRHPANLAVIASCAVVGAVVWFEREAALRSLRAELGGSFGRTHASEADPSATEEMQARAVSTERQQAGLWRSRGRRL